MAVGERPASRVLAVGPRSFRFLVARVGRHVAKLAEAVDQPAEHVEARHVDALPGGLSGESRDGGLGVQHERHAESGESALEQREFLATHGQSKREARRQTSSVAAASCEPHPKLSLL